MATGPTYCTILAENYLPKALALAESLNRHHPDGSLLVLLVDAAHDADLPDVPDIPGLQCVSTDFLGLPDAEVRRLAAVYDLVEFATAVKPVLLRRLLEGHEFTAYLDPDTYVTAPMDELPVDLAASAGGLLLTPHYLQPIRDESMLGEGHLLHVGVFNLGFCAVDRRSTEFLDWWWGHLRNECRWEPLSGLFVDQKWVDIGNTLFRGEAWSHAGYNVGVGNLHERPLARTEGGIRITTTGEPLRLFHFHAFDPESPELTTRFDASSAHLRTSNEVVDALSAEYAEAVLRHRRSLRVAPAYRYATDTDGRPISRHLRRAHRLEGEAGAVPPSPFVASEREAWERWRRRARWTAARESLGDATKSLRLAFPEEYGRWKAKYPRLARSLRSGLVRASGIWR